MNQEEEKKVPEYLHPFAVLVKDYLMAEYEEGLNEGPKDYNRASDIGKDLFTNYHKRIGTPKTNHPSAEALGKMGAGDVFHWYIQGLFKKMGILKDKETKIRIEEIDVVGHYDANTGVSAGEMAV